MTDAERRFYDERVYVSRQEAAVILGVAPDAVDCYVGAKAKALTRGQPNLYRLGDVLAVLRERAA